MRNHSRLLASLLCALAFTCQAQSTQAPDLKEGDSWLIQYTQEKNPNIWLQNQQQLTILRVTAKNILLANKQPEAGLPAKEYLVNKDWSETRMIDGEDTLTYQPLSFPLTTGKTWHSSFIQPHPNKDIKSATFDVTYTVLGPEDIAVKGGRFKAIKIEGEGRWLDEMLPVQAVVQGVKNTEAGTTMSTERVNQAATKRAGRLYRVMWYAPEVKRWVKSIEEQYTPEGSRFERRTFELLSYSLKDQP